ncbi:MAG: Fe(2+) transporter permease subunit FeoB [Ilumatobacter sp.]|uniref:Fe(2+) transporter permease subunit FeoB n=1 Tax=Ilumatobacter sp. TaxID=1967498 RepID=UPI00263567E1|nr:Fe(2+) transporter permease subunit FeoB [Ilumatobacter sp.]MDJ0767472.1 Fe(2+) transporter permease subunit FeoB [Ilumatobacter sp.]
MRATTAPVAAPTRDRTTVVAIVGNPNAGKTALFNALTGIRQKTGNWPGVTVDRKEGRYRFDDRRFSVVDLPGTYSLEATSPDQRIARDFVVGHDLDVVVDVVDATNLERQLYLAVQLAEMRVPRVVALNMIDVAERHGLAIDVSALSAALGCPVVPMVAISGDGVDELQRAIADVADAGTAPGWTVDYGERVEHAIDAIGELLRGDHGSNDRADDLRWQALRLLDGDEAAVAGVDPATAERVRSAVDELGAQRGEDVDVVLADRRFTVANEIARRVTARPNVTIGSLSDRVDRLVIHRFWGVPIFLTVMYLMFMFTINVGGAFVDVFDGIAGAIFVDGFGEVLGAIGSPEWLVVPLTDGVGGGIQVVATFVPIIGALYLFMAVLEDSGYMARAAFVMDRTMRRIGLPGKAFVPMIVGFGCNVPAVMATRTLEDERERKLTILMNPFMSCGARLPVYALFAAAFFPSSGQNVVFGLYLIGIAVAIGTGLLMSHSLLPGESEGFLMELPAYHRPTARGTFLHAWDRLRVFVRNAGTVIIAMVVVLAVLNSIGTDGSFGNEDSEESALSEVGRTITPVFEPMGLDEDNWPATVGIFTGVLAKEAVVGSLDSLYGELAEEDAGEVVADEPFEFWTSIGDAVATVPDNLAAAADTLTDPLGLTVGEIGALESAADEQEVDAGVYGAMESRFDGRVGAFAYLLFVLLYFPCVATIGAIVREAGRRWALFVAAWTTGIAFVVATGFYQAATVVDHPVSSVVWLGFLTLVVVVAFGSLRRWARREPQPPEPAATPVVVRTRR